MNQVNPKDTKAHTAPRDNEESQRKIRELQNEVSVARLELSQQQNEMIYLKNSLTYRVGSVIMFFPKKIAAVARKLRAEGQKSPITHQATDQSGGQSVEPARKRTVERKQDRSHAPKHSLRVSAVVCTHNRSDLLRKAILSLVNQNCSRDLYEIRVINNASTDNTAEVLQEFMHEPNFHSVYKSLLGVSYARNAGWESAKADIVAYLDDDAIADPDWIENIIRAFDSEAKPDVVGGKVDPLWNEGKPEWVNDKYMENLAVINWSETPRILKENEWFVCTNTAYRKSAIASVNGFNTLLGRNGRGIELHEEYMLNETLRAKGFTLFYDPSILVRHHIFPERLQKDWVLGSSFQDGMDKAKIQSINEQLSSDDRLRLARDKVRECTDLMNKWKPEDGNFLPVDVETIRSLGYAKKMIMDGYALLDEDKKNDLLLQERLLTNISERGMVLLDQKGVFFPVNLNADEGLKLFFSRFIAEKHKEEKTRYFIRAAHKNYVSLTLRSFWKWTVVRNPWERLVCAYQNLILQEDVTDKLYENGVHRLLVPYGKFAGQMSFADFASAVSQIPDEKSIPQLRSQFTFITNREGECIVDHIARYENLENDVRHICKKLNLEPGTIANSLSDKVHSYWIHYDNSVRKTVEKRYAKDISLFGYAFEDGSRSVRPEDSFHLITTLYNEKDPERQREYIRCVKNNLENPYIKEVHIFFDDNGQQSALHDFLRKSDVRMHHINGRPTYEDCFRFANEHLPNSRIIVANGDIYFNTTLGLLEQYSLKRTMLSVTRWNQIEDGSLVPFRPKLAYITVCKVCGHKRGLQTKKDIVDCYYDPPCWKGGKCTATFADMEVYPGNNYDYSAHTQDAWIFETPLKIDMKCDYRIGTYHCDGFLNYQLLRSENLLHVCNPSNDIQCCHIHNTNTKSQDDVELIMNDKAELKRNNEMGNFLGAIPIKPLAKCNLRKK